MNALEVLREDHAVVRALLADLGGTPPRGVMTRARLFGALRARFGHHELVEEELLYPILERRERLPDQLAEGRRDHVALEALMTELATVTYDDEAWRRQFAALRAALERHLDDEEAQLFGRIREALSERELDQLGQRMDLQRDSSRPVAPPA